MSGDIQVPIPINEPVLDYQPGSPERQQLKDKLLASDYVAPPLRAHDCSALALGAAALVLVAGERAKELCERPAWIRGIDHRVDPHYPGVRDLSLSPSAKLAGERAGVGGAAVEVAELCASYSHEEFLLRDALGLGDDVEINPSGGALVSNPPMVAGLTRIGEAFRQIRDRGRRRTLAHASSGLSSLRFSLVFSRLPMRSAFACTRFPVLPGR